MSRAGVQARDDGRSRGFKMRPCVMAGVEAVEAVLPNGLVERARIGLSPAGIELDVEPIAFGPLRLQAPDGRLSLFPRAMCRVRAADGRAGLGWVEWNLNQR